MGRYPHPLPTPVTPYWEMFAHHLRAGRTRFASKSRPECTLFHLILWRIEGAVGWGSTPSSCLPLPPHIGKCSRAPGAWCGIGSTRNRVPNALYFMRIREDLGQLGRVQVPPTCSPQEAPAKSGARARRRARTLDAGVRARREGPRKRPEALGGREDEIRPVIY